MTARLGLVVAAALALGASALTARQDPTTAPQALPARTEVVTVDVSVRRGADDVGGLAAHDFVLLDNGVPQHLEIVDSSVVPVDVTMLVETDREVDDRWDDVNRQAARIASQLRPADRLRVWNIDTSVTEVRPLSRVGAGPTLPRMEGGGLGAIYDAIGAALMEPIAPDARHHIIAVTNGIDTDSVLSLKTVRALAARSDAILQIAQIDVGERTPDTHERGARSASAHEDLRDAQCAQFSCEPTHRFFQPHYDPPNTPDRFAPLAAVAGLTGGAVQTLGLLVEEGPTDAFPRARQDSLEHYVLRYTPQGVGRDGWHTITVTIPAYPKDVVHARRGYGGETPTGSGGATLTPAPASTPARSPADGVLAAYDRGDYAAALDIARAVPDATALVADLRARGNLWPANPHREAVFALDLSRIALVSGGDAVRTPVEDWLIDEGRLVRAPLGPDAFEPDWLAAELTLLIAPIRPAGAEPFAAAALARFPDDPRFLFDAALLADQRWTTGTNGALSASQSVRQVADVLAQYDAVIARHDVPALEAEARVRSAWLLHRASRDPDALTRLQAVHEADADPATRYLAQLFLGHVLSALHRPTEALAAYRAATALQPEAESGTVALMNGLLATGDRPGAVALAERIQTRPAPSATVDPWHVYWQGDYRHFPDLVAHLRETLR
jgi:hypothetical protein